MTEREMHARTLRERRDRDEADRPFCAGMLRRRLIAANLSERGTDCIYAGRITDPEHVLPAPQVAQLVRIARAYGHTWVRDGYQGRSLTQAEAASSHVPDLTVRGNSPPQARSPAGEVWAYSSTAVWRCMPDGRLMIWLYSSHQTCAPDQLRLSRSAAIFEIAEVTGYRIRIVKGRGRQRRSNVLVSAAPAAPLWESSPLSAAFGTLEAHQDRDRLPTHRIVNDSDRAIGNRVASTLRRSRK